MESRHGLWWFVTSMLEVWEPNITIVTWDVMMKWNSGLFMFFFKEIPNYKGSYYFHLQFPWLSMAINNYEEHISYITIIIKSWKYIHMLLSHKALHYKLPCGKYVSLALKMLDRMPSNLTVFFIWFLKVFATCHVHIGWDSLVFFVELSTWH